MNQSHSKAVTVFVAIVIAATYSTVRAVCTPPIGDAACIDPPSITVTGAAGSNFTHLLSVTTGAVPISKVDVVFAVDRTGSMGDEIASVKANAVSIMNAIRSLVPDSWFGVVSFMDYPGYFSYPGYVATYGSAASGDVPFMINRPVAVDIASVAAALQALTLGSGGDGPQDYTRVLYDSLHEGALSWRPDAKRILIMFGDDATHDTNFAGYNFGGDPGHDQIAMTADDLNFETVVQELRDAGMVVLAVNSGSTSRAEATFRGMSVGYAGASGTNGRYFQLSNAGQIPQVVEDLVGDESRIVHQLALRVAEPYAGWLTNVDPPFHAEVGPNTTVEFNVTFTVPSTATTGEYAFAIRAIGDGTFLAFSNVAITIPAAEQITDLNFRPEPDGFAFNNRSSAASWEMFRQYYGRENVEFSNGSHMPTAQAFFDEHYRVSGEIGSCNGFSVASLVSFLEIPQPNSGPFAMPHVDNLSSTGAFGDYTNALTYYQASQLSRSIATRLGMSRRGTPSVVLAEILNALGNGSPGVIGIFHVDDGVTLGHALSPYRIVSTEDRAEVFVYDSNYRRDNDRRIVFDLEENTWTYRIEDPFLWFFGGETWEGDADNGRINFGPLSMYTDVGVPFWTPGAGDDPTVTISVTGSGPVTIGDGSGHFAGSGARALPSLVTAMPIQPLWAWNPIQDAEAYLLPAGAEYGIDCPADTAAHSLSVYGANALSRVAVNGAGAFHADVMHEGLSLGFSASSAAPCSLQVARVVGDQGRSATWTYTPIPEARVAAYADQSAQSVALSNGGASFIYELQLRTLGLDASARGVLQRSIGAGETHAIHLGDWISLNDRDIIIDVDSDGDGAAERHLIETEATLDIDPDVLNAGSNGQYVMALLQLRAPWAGATFDPTAFRLGSLPTLGPVDVGDANADGVADIAVKFDRAAVIEGIGDVATWYPVVTGFATNMDDTIFFAARDTVVILRPRILRPTEGEIVAGGSQYRVQWDMPAAIGADVAALQYSIDGGENWVLVSDGLRPVDAFDWDVPSADAPHALIRVAAYRDGTHLIDGETTAFKISDVTSGVENATDVSVLRLYAPWPAPFDREINIRYDLPASAHTRLSIYDISGRRVRLLVDSEANIGSNTVVWDGTNEGGARVAAGVYILRLDANGATRSKRIVMVR